MTIKAGSDVVSNTALLWQMRLSMHDTWHQIMCVLGFAYPVDLVLRHVQLSEQILGALPACHHLVWHAIQNEINEKK